MVASKLVVVKLIVGFISWSRFFGAGYFWANFGFVVVFLLAFTEKVLAGEISSQWRTDITVLKRHRHWIALVFVVTRSIVDRTYGNTTQTTNKK